MSSVRCNLCLKPLAAAVLWTLAALTVYAESRAGDVQSAPAPPATAFAPEAAALSVRQPAVHASWTGDEGLQDTAPQATAVLEPSVRLGEARRRLEAQSREFAPPADAPAPLPPPMATCCTGPVPCVPQYVYGKHYRGGFLYYGTFPYDDDWFNNFSGCSKDSADCAPLSTAIGRWWINLHNHFPGPAYRCGHDATAAHGGHR